MGITANVKNEQIVASVGETKIDVSVGGGVGPTGSAGAAATVSVGTVTTGAAGSSATVTNVGTSSAAVFNFTIPAGATGAAGPAGAAGATGAAGPAGTAATVSVGTVTTGAAGSSASVTNVGTSSAAVFNFTIPAGATGATGPQGATGPAGTTTWAGITDKPSTFAPSAHAASHAVGGADVLTPADIGAAAASALVYVRGSGSGSVRPPFSGATASGIGAVVLSGDPASADGDYAFVGGGSANSAAGDYAVVSGGYGNAARTDYSSIAGGTFNDTDTFTNAHIVGSYITALANDYAYVNNLHIVGAWNGTALAGGSLKFPDASVQTTAYTGKIGTTSGLVLKTGTDGAIEALAMGTAGQVLKVNSGATGVEWVSLGSAASASTSDFAAASHTHAQLHDRSHAITSSSDHTATAWRLFYSNGSGVITELTLGSSGTVLTSAGASAAPTFSALPSGGSTNVWIPASAFIPRTTNGCGVDSRETSTNRTNWDELLFDAGADEFAQAAIVLPSNYNAGTFTARFYWTASGATDGSDDVIWGIQARAFANDDALDTAFGTAQTVADTVIATNDMHVSSATSAVTAGGTPAANVPLLIQIYRDADAAGDTYGHDARLLGVEIIYTAA